MPTRFASQAAFSNHQGEENNTEFFETQPTFQENAQFFAQTDAWCENDASTEEDENDCDDASTDTPVDTISSARRGGVGVGRPGL
jgi:hypothetical protein